ncbi:MAG: 2-thiouracil desulfurase family protein [Thermoleophilia bacterium]
MTEPAPAGGGGRTDRRPPLLVSGCLVGLRTRFDGGHHRHEAVLDLAESFTLVPVCPEQLGGLGTPRPPAEIQAGCAADGGARVISRDGTDVSDEFRRGAESVLAVARIVGARAAVLKARSPSCGVGAIYDGTFTRTVRAGSGVTAGLLEREGLEVHTEEDIAAGLRPGGLRSGRE